MRGPLQYHHPNNHTPKEWVSFVQDTLEALRRFLMWPQFIFSQRPTIIQRLNSKPLKRSCQRRNDWALSERMVVRFSIQRMLIVYQIGCKRQSRSHWPSSRLNRIMAQGRPIHAGQHRQPAFPLHDEHAHFLDLHGSDQLSIPMIHAHVNDCISQETFIALSSAWLPRLRSVMRRTLRFIDRKKSKRRTFSSHASSTVVSE